MGEGTCVADLETDKLVVISPRQGNALWEGERVGLTHIKAAGIPARDPTTRLRLSGTLSARVVLVLGLHDLLEVKEEVHCVRVSARLRHLQ